MIEVTPLTGTLTDDMIVLRASTPEDAVVLSANHDHASRRYLGDPHPNPWACIIVDDEVTGWIDYDYGREWLAPTEANIGFMVFPDLRRRGYAVRALSLLVEKHLVETQCTRATMLIKASNSSSLAVATRSGFAEQASRDGGRFFARTTTL